MIPNLPTNLYNIIFTIGAFLVAFSFIQSQKLSETQKDYQRKFEILNEQSIDRSFNFTKKKERMYQNLMSLYEKAKEVRGNNIEELNDNIKKAEIEFDEVDQ